MGPGRSGLSRVGRQFQRTICMLAGSV
jgi:hypothetical protein